MTETAHVTRRRDEETSRRARSLRKGDNPAEALLWNELKGRKLGGYKFVRQFPVGPYFADFLCRERKLVVELDGSQHAGSFYDEKRNAFMRARKATPWSASGTMRYSGSATRFARRSSLLSQEGSLRMYRRMIFAICGATMDRLRTPHRLAALATSPQRGEEKSRLEKRHPLSSPLWGEVARRAGEGSAAEGDRP